MIDQTKPYWYAFVTRPRHEKKVEQYLCSAEIENYLPLHKELHQWKDRRKFVDVPLFSCYIFANVAYSSRYDVLKAPSVVRIVSIGKTPTPVHDEEIEAIKRVLKSEQLFEVSSQLHEGDFVEIIAGPLTGIKGDLITFRGNKKIVINIGAIGQSLIVEVYKNQVRRVSR